MMTTKQKIGRLLAGLALTWGPLAKAAELPSLDSYNIVWDSPSNNVNGTMPLGNGDISANVWVQDGDLLFLIGKTDAWDENSINCKLARVRVKMSPNPFAAGNPFRQELRLQQGDMLIKGGAPGSEVTLRLWVDANQPVIRVQTHSDQPVSQQVLLETWRNEQSVLTNTQTSDMFKNLYGPDPYPTLLFPDTIVQGQKDRLLWYHHNIKPENDPYEINLRLQAMQDYMKVIPHPLLGRTFGASIQGPGFTAADAKTLNTIEARKSHVFSVYPLTTLAPVTPEQWKDKLDGMITKVDSKPLADAYTDHLAWWKAFWNRSEIHLAETNPANIPADGLSPAFTISRAYALCRFMNAAGGRGAQPIKYNGSIFTVGTPDNPDFRQWGGPGFWFQNQRLVYWPMLAAGDFDLMEPWFRMYREALPFAKMRCQKYFKHDGANFGETILFWGAEASAHYGWTPFEQRSIPNCECPYLTYYWQNNIENMRMMLDYFEHTGDMEFARHTLMPHADEVTKFYDLHYKRDENGKIRFDPAASLETWHTAVNPLPEIAGLGTQLPRLLGLPDGLTTGEQRTRWNRILKDLPPIPKGTKEGLPVILPAETFSREENYETPELYCVFPYSVYGIDKPDLELARNTYATRKHKKAECWYQDQVHSALLGLVDESRQGIIARASAASHSNSRFPAFWNAFHDWVPDIDHGGNLQLALQLMLLQADPGPTGKIRLLPTWPKDWDVSFKLHAPGGFETSAEQVSGLIRNVRIKSTLGGSLRIAKPWPGYALKVLAKGSGSSVQVTETNGIHSFPTTAGESYLLSRGEASEPPSTPVGLQAYAGNTTALLDWNPAPAASSYIIKRSTDGVNFTTIGSATGTSHVDSNLANGSTYHYKVRAINALGESTDTQAVSVLPGGLNCISINFQGGCPGNGTPLAMADSESAGHVSANHWNTISGVSGTAPSLIQNNGSRSAASINWSSHGLWSTPITDEAGNHRMMKGYLDTNDISTTRVVVSGLPKGYASAGYEVYLYVDGHSNATDNKQGRYTLDGSLITVIDAASTDFGGTFKLANDGTGNCIVYSNRTNPGFTLTATPDTRQPGGRAPLNGIQIVGRVANGPPLAAKGPAASALSDTAVEITWNDLATDEDAYQVEFSPAGADSWTACPQLAPGSTKYVASGLEPGTNYDFRVKALNTGGVSTSATVSHATLAKGAQADVIESNTVSDEASVPEVNQ